MTRASQRERHSAVAAKQPALANRLDRQHTPVAPVSARAAPAVSPALRHPTAGRARADATRAAQRTAGNEALGHWLDDILQGYFAPRTDAGPAAVVPEPGTPGSELNPLAGKPTPGAIADAEETTGAAVGAGAPAPTAEEGAAPPAAEATVAAPTDTPAEELPSPAGSRPGAVSGVSPGGAGPLLTGAKAEAAAPAGSAPDTVRQWQDQIQEAATAVPHPTVSPAPVAGATAVVTAAGQRAEQAQAEVSAAAAAHVPPQPRAPESPPLPPDPVPKATEAVRKAVEATLPDLVLPALVATSSEPPVLKPLPTPPAAPKEGEPTTKAAAPLTRHEAKQVPAKEARAAETTAPDLPTLVDPRKAPGPQAGTEPASAKLLPPDEELQLVLRVGEAGTKPAPAKPPPPDEQLQLDLRVGEAIAEATTRVPDLVKTTLSMARAEAYPTLGALFPDLDKDFEPKLTAELAAELTGIAAAVGLSKEHLDALSTERREHLAASAATAAADGQQAAQAATKEVEGAAGKTMRTIAAERRRAAAETYRRMTKAMTSTDPDFIPQVVDELVVRLRGQVTRGAASHRRAAQRRVEEIVYFHGRYIDAYRTAHMAAMSKERAEGRGVTAAENLRTDTGTGKSLLAARLKELDTAMKLLQEGTTKTGEGLAKAVEASGPVAYDLVRDWGAEALHRTRTAEEKLLDTRQDSWEQQERRLQGMAELKAAENSEALVGDIIALRNLDTVQARATAVAAAAGTAALQVAVAAVVKTRVTDPVALLAEKVAGRLVHDPDRLAALATELRKKVDAIDPYALDNDGREKLSQVLFGDPGGARIKAEALVEATGSFFAEKEGVYAALGGLTASQGRLVAAAFQTTHPNRMSLDLALYEAMSGAELERARDLARGDKVGAAAAAVYLGILGPSTNVKQVKDTLRGLSETELAKLDKLYAKRYGETLTTALKGDFRGRNEQQEVLALASGDKAAAGAWAIEDKLHGSFLGPDHKAVAEIHTQLRNEVAEANPDMGSEELDMEVRLRTAEVEAAYQTNPGQGKTLEETYNTELPEGPARDLPIALLHNDMDGADAARAALVQKSAQGNRVDVDDELKAVTKARNDRIADTVRRDVGPDLRKKLRTKIGDARVAGKEMSWADRQMEERQLQVDLRKETEKRSAESMSTLEKRFDEKYSGIYTHYTADGVLETKTGGLRTMIDMFATGQEVKHWYAQGYLSLAQDVYYSTAGRGTDEDRLKDVTKGRTKNELEEARKEFEDKYHQNMDTIVLAKLDPGTRDYLDVSQNLRGAPETVDEMMARAREKYEFETRTYGVSGTWLEPDTRKILDEDFAALQAKFTALQNPSHKATPEDIEYLHEAFGASHRTLDSAVGLYRHSVDALVGTATQIVGIVVGLAVAAALTALTGGLAAPALIALDASLWATTATIATKMILLGRAYGVQDYAHDLAIGAIDAAVAAATAGFGDKLLKAAEGVPPGVLARMASSGSKAAQASAKAAAEVLEQVVQAAPNALAATLLDDSTYRGDVFTNIVKRTAEGTATSVAMGLAMSSAMHVGGSLVRAVRGEIGHLRGKPPSDVDAFIGSAAAKAAERAEHPGRPADLLELRGTPLERRAAFLEYQRKYPGADYAKDFLPALDRGHASLQASADAARQLDRSLRKELMQRIPKELRGQFAKTRIEVVSDAEFVNFGHSPSGQAVVIIENGKPQVIMRESASPRALREEGIHLWQSVDPRTAAKVARLDEARLRGWDSLSTAEKLDLYSTKFELEVDAQQRMLAHLDEELGNAHLEPEHRTALETDVRDSRRTLENLERLRSQVDILGPDDILRIGRGEQHAPVDLNQPSRLFSKRAKERARAKPSKSTLGAKKLGLSMVEVESVLGRPGVFNKGFRHLDAVIESLKDRPEDIAAIRDVLATEAAGGNIVGFREWLKETGPRALGRDAGQRRAQVLDKMAEITEVRRLAREVKSDPDLFVQFVAGKGSKESWDTRIKTEGGKSFDIRVMSRTKLGTVRRIEVSRLKKSPARWKDLDVISHATEKLIQKNVPLLNRLGRELFYGRPPPLGGTVESSVVIPALNTPTTAGTGRVMEPNGDYRTPLGESRNIYRELAAAIGDEIKSPFIEHLDAVNIVDESGQLVVRIERFIADKLGRPVVRIEDFIADESGRPVVRIEDVKNEAYKNVWDIVFPDELEGRFARVRRLYPPISPPTRR